jgi:DNA-binding CsgD family transcriptional regulator
MKPAVTGNQPACHRRMASQLSPRQREILDLVAEGRTSKEIAVTLGISESTVNWHLANAFERLGASSRAEAVALAIRSNGADRAAAAPPARVPPTLGLARVGWRRLIAIAIAIAVAGALLGGATVATLRLVPLGPVQGPSASPTNGSVRTPTSSPASGTHEEVVGGGIAPVDGGRDVGPDPMVGPLPEPPATLLPAVTVPPLPSVSVPLPTPALPSLPVSTPPLPSLPLPTPIPTPRLSLP